MAVNVRETVQAFDRDLEVEVAKDKMALWVQAPADYDWGPLVAFLAKHKGSHLQPFRDDDHAANYDALERPDDGDDSAEARAQRQLWECDVLQAPLAGAELALVFRARLVLAPGADGAVADPRLDEVVRIAAAAESLWRARLGDERYDLMAEAYARSLPDPAAKQRPVDSSQRHPHGRVVPRRVLGMQAVTGERQQVWEWTAMRAWQRAEKVLAEVAQHCEGVVRKGRGSPAVRARYRRTVALLRRLEHQSRRFTQRLFH